MAFPWGIVALLFGIVYGVLVPGRQDKARLFRNGVLIGLVAALVMAVLGVLLNVNPIGIGTGVIGMIIGFIVLTLLFILGVWLGDLIEGAPKRH